MAQTMRQTTHKEVLGCSQHGVSGSSSWGITSALLPARYLGFQKPFFNTPVLSRASPSLVVLCEGLSRTRPGAEHLFSSLPSAKPSPPPFAPLGGPEPGGLCCRCHGLGRKESNSLCHVEMEHPMPTLYPFHPHPMPICSPWHPPSVSEGPTLQQCPRGVGAALCPSPAFPSQPFLKLFFPSSLQTQQKRQIPHK